MHFLREGVAFKSILLAVACGGLSFGGAIGFLPVFVHIESITNDCSTMPHADCSRSQHCSFVGGQCTFNADGVCSLETTFDRCVSVSDTDTRCIFLSNMCVPSGQLPAAAVGALASVLAVGGLAAASAGHSSVKVFGYRGACFAAAACSLAAASLFHLFPHTFAALLIARLLQGVAGGLICAVCPTMADVVLPEPLRQLPGIVIQLSITLGIAITALLGLCLSSGAQPPTEVSLEIFILLQTCFGLAFLAAAMQLPHIHSPTGGPLSTGGGSLCTAKALRPLTIAFFLCIAQQMTGINAIMNYAPTITKAMGLTPMMGNFVVMLWNFVTTLLAIPVASRFTMRQMYLMGLGGVSAACLGMYASLVSSHSDAVSHGAVACVMLFIAAYEVGMGPSFFSLCQSIFPQHLQSQGNSFAMSTQFFFNIVINAIFPVAIQQASALFHSDSRGLGTVFGALGVVGVASCGFLFAYLPQPKRDVKALV